MNQKIKFGRSIRYDDKENDNLIFFQPPKKQVHFDEAKNQIWTIDRYDDKENDKRIFFQPPNEQDHFDEEKIKFGPSIDMMIKKMTSSSSSLLKNESILMNQRIKFGRMIDMMIKKMTSRYSSSLRKNKSVLMNQNMKFGPS